MSQPHLLQAASARCIILPELGGSLGGWWIGTQALLRPAEPALIARGDPIGLSAFPLVPYSNRIGMGKFGWNGRQHHLRRNRAGEPHALHGVGWQREWKLVDLSRSSAELQLDHPGDGDWPWPFTATQRIGLQEERLELTFLARNAADETVPLAFGYHPYFVRERARVRLKADRVWLAGDTNLPRAAAVPAGHLDLSTFDAVADRLIDNCYEHVAWPAEIAWAHSNWRVKVEPTANLRHAVVYSNAKAGALCIEPVAHLNDALNLGDESASFPIIAAGETFRAGLCFQVLPSHDGPRSET